LVDQPDVRTAADVVQLVEGLGPYELLGALFAEENRNPVVDGLIQQAAQGDRSVLDQLAERLPEWHRKGRLELLRDPVGARDRIVDVLRAWQAPFPQIESRVLGILERDYDDRAEDRQRLAPPDLIETTTGGVRYLPEPGINRVILAPSFFSRPF